MKGRVINEHGLPVIGAQILARSDTPLMLGPSATSNDGGYFSLGLPPGTKWYDVVVTAFGYAATTARAQVIDRKMVMIPLESQGGQLILELPANADARLFHAGGEYFARSLATNVGGGVEQRDGWEVATLPEVERGDYRLCIASRCTSGIVPPNGSLTLSVRD